jgi:hypothetical protein
MKVDVNVSKKFTFNTGNYTSIQPVVSVTARDVDVEDVKKVHEKLNIITDVLIHDQIQDDAVTMATVKKLGFKEYFNKIDKDKMQNEMTKAIRDLTKGEF